MDLLNEGNVKFHASKGKITRHMGVFYNPAKTFDRDLNLLLLKALDFKGLALDLMSASGIRGLRIAKETNAKKIVMNDYDKKAVENIEKNIKINSLKNCEVKNLPADKLLVEREYYDYLDYDPYGSPIEFLDLCVKKVQRKGMLGVCATDTAALKGSNINACKRKYGSTPFRGDFKEEIGLRILIKKVIETGCQHEIALTPVFGHCTMHYYRAYFKKDLGAKRCDELIKKIKTLSYCRTCMSINSNCSHKKIIFGPIWTGELWDSKTVNKMINQAEGRNKEFLKLILEEAGTKTLGYFRTDKLASITKTQEKNMSELIQKLRNKRFKASRTHFHNKGLKSNIQLKELIKTLK